MGGIHVHQPLLRRFRLFKIMIINFNQTDPKHEQERERAREHLRAVLLICISSREDFLHSSTSVAMSSVPTNQFQLGEAVEVEKCASQGDSPHNFGATPHVLVGMFEGPAMSLSIAIGGFNHFRAGIEPGSCRRSAATRHRWLNCRHTPMNGIRSSASPKKASPISDFAKLTARKSKARSDLGNTSRHLRPWIAAPGASPVEVT